MSIGEEKLWNREIRSKMIEDLSQYLSLYLFKGNISDVSYGIESLFQLTPDEVSAQKAAHFLLSEELNEFIKVLPFLLRNLAHSSKKEMIEYRGLIRGKVDWSQTYKTRYANGFDDKSLFICLPASKSYDLEENQLLKYMLRKIVLLYEKTLSFIDNPNIEVEYEEIDDDEEERIINNWQDIVNNRYYIVKKSLKNVYFNNITDVKRIKPKTLRKAKNHRNPYYQKLAKLSELYENLFVYDNKESLKQLVEKQLLKPASNDTLYELFIFFSIVDNLAENKKFGLLIPGNDYSVSSTIGDIDVKIYYQGVPKDIFSKCTKYKKIFENYDIGVNLRRPDVLIEFEKEGKTYYRIVEVKRTSKPNYIRDSVYKVLGYLNDFEGIPFTKNIPGVITCWEGVKMDNRYGAFDQEILILNKRDFLDNLNELLSLE